MLLRSIFFVIKTDFDEVTHLIVALQQKGADTGFKRYGSFAHFVEQGLDVMRKFHDAVQTKYAGGALHGVGATE